jgi:hypothetical protein
MVAVHGSLAGVLNALLPKNARIVQQFPKINQSALVKK